MPGFLFCGRLLGCRVIGESLEYPTVASRSLLPGEYAVLAVLAVEPMHGYDIACFLAADGLDAVCPVEQSTLYTYLHNVESRGLVTWSEARVGNRPPRKMFALTPEGESLIRAWLRRPVERMREVRLEFLLKLFFLNLTDPAAVEGLLARQIAVCEGYLAQIRTGALESPFRRLVALSKASAAEATLTWLRQYANEREQETTK